MSSDVLRCPLSHLLCTLSQSCARRECLWSDQAGLKMVFVWFLQEAQGKYVYYSNTMRLPVSAVAPNLMEG